MSVLSRHCVLRRRSRIARRDRYDRFVCALPTLRRNDGLKIRPTQYNNNTSDGDRHNAQRAHVSPRINQSRKVENVNLNENVTFGRTSCRKYCTIVHTCSRLERWRNASRYIIYCDKRHDYKPRANNIHVLTVRTENGLTSDDISDFCVDSIENVPKRFIFSYTVIANTRFSNIYLSNYNSDNLDFTTSRISNILRFTYLRASRSGVMRISLFVGTSCFSLLFDNK